jgi:hypothetical protein
MADRPFSTTRIAGISGLLMVGTIAVNGPLSMALERAPASAAPDASARWSAYVADPSALRMSALFFFLSCFIFVFGIPFFAGIRLLARTTDPSGLVSGVVSIGAALFFAGGLVSEITTAGVPLVAMSVPDWRPDANSALLLNGLWFAAISQAQVALATVMITVSFASLRGRVLPPWVAWLGIAAGVVDIARPLLVQHPTAFIVAFQPSLLWLLCVAIVLVRHRAAPRTPPIATTSSA